MHQLCVLELLEKGHFFLNYLKEIGFFRRMYRNRDVFRPQGKKDSPSQPYKYHAGQAYKEWDRIV